ncbi:MAG TPA: HEAT repeat domain-containing protein [Pyrinomonadaceae bacterium]|jgi:HEAT repeat protein
MAKDKASIPGLIEQVMRHPNEVFSKDREFEAASRLAKSGAPAVLPILKAMQGPYPPGQHPVDVVEALGCVLKGIARRESAPLVEVLEGGAFPPDAGLSYVVYALRDANDERALRALISALKHPHKYIRDAAASVLVEKDDGRVVVPLVEALSDKSSSVKFTVVQAMRRRTDLRDTRALEPLKRIVASKSLQKHSPGMCEYASEVIGMIEGRGGPS